MDALFGAGGILVIIVAIAYLIWCIVKKKTKKWAVIGIVLGFVIFIVGMNMPVDHNRLGVKITEDFARENLSEDNIKVDKKDSKVTKLNKQTKTKDGRTYESSYVSSGKITINGVNHGYALIYVYDSKPEVLFFSLHDEANDIYDNLIGD